MTQFEKAISALDEAVTGGVVGLSDGFSLLPGLVKKCMADQAMMASEVGQQLRQEAAKHGLLRDGGRGAWASGSRAQLMQARGWQGAMPQLVGGQMRGQPYGAGSSRAKPTDICRGCGAMGHWMKDCTNTSAAGQMLPHMGGGVPANFVPIGGGGAGAQRRM